MSRRPKLPRPVGVGEILEKLLRPADLQVLELRHRLRRAWDEVAGERLRAVTTLVDYRYKVLWVEVPSHAWMQELQFHQGALLRALDDALAPGVVKDLRFCLPRGGPASPPPDDGPADTSDAAFPPPRPEKIRKTGRKIK